MSKLSTLENQREKALSRQQEFLAKAKKEGDKVKELETQIILARHEERSDYLAKHNLTWADVERQIEEGKLKGDLSDVSANQSNTGHNNNLQE